VSKYDEAIYWIAFNDEPGETRVKEMANLMTVVLIADLYGVDPVDVAKDVISRRLSRHQPQKVSYKPS